MILRHFSKAICYFIATFFITSCWSNNAKKSEKTTAIESLSSKTDTLMIAKDSIAIKIAELKLYKLNKARFLFRPPNSLVSYTIKRMYGIIPLREVSTPNPQVESFKVTVKRDGEIIAQFNNKGSFFSEELFKFNMEKSKKGDHWLFYDIKFKLENGEIIVLDQLQWTE